MTRPSHAPGTFSYPALLVLLTGISYIPVLSAGFIKYFDDNFYVYDNAVVKGGFSAGALRWSLETFTGGNWNPLTWWSHMLDVELYGLNPAGHHATSLVIHIINALLMYLLFSRTTGEKVKSFMVAALFALHPLHVESVAWVAERKDVLSTLFALLALLSYAAYAASGALKNYALMFICFCLSLMAKPMYVTLPFVMLLMDYWPLQRCVVKDSRYRILEKLPMLVPAAAVSWVTIIAQRSQDGLVEAGGNPLSVSIPAALKAYVVYLQQTFVPRNLIFFYPHETVPPAIAALCLLLLGSISAAAYIFRRKAPWFGAGWLLYLGTLFPVIGIIRVGWQGHADRYTYFPLTGIFIICVWGSGLILINSRNTAFLLSGAILVICSLLTFRQAGWWQESEKLYGRALALSRENWLASNNLGGIYLERGDTARAEMYLRRALEARPDYDTALYNMGNLDEASGRFESAVANYRRAIRLKPDYLKSYRGLARVFEKTGNLEQARDVLREARMKCGDDPDLLAALGKISAMLGLLQEAETLFRQALQLDPEHPAAQEGLFRMAGQPGKQ